MSGRAVDAAAVPQTRSEAGHVEDDRNGRTEAEAGQKEPSDIMKELPATVKDNRGTLESCARVTGAGADMVCGCRLLGYLTVPHASTAPRVGTITARPLLRPLCYTRWSC